MGERNPYSARRAGTSTLEVPREEEVTEQGGDRFRRRLVAVRSPGGSSVCFEGANEADSAAG